MKDKLPNQEGKCPKDGETLDDCLPYALLWCRKCERHYEKNSKGKIMEHHYSWEEWNSGDTD